jgi:hypothetical protein
MDLSQLTPEQLAQLVQLMQAMQSNAADPMGPFSNDGPTPAPVADTVFGVRVAAGFRDVYGPLPFSSQFRDVPRQAGGGNPWQQAHGRMRQLAQEFGGLVNRGDPNYPGDSEIDRASAIYETLGMGRVRLFYGSPGQLGRVAVMAYFPHTGVKQDLLWAPENPRNAKYPCPLRPYRVEGWDGDQDTVLDDPGYRALDPSNIDHIHANYVWKLKRDGLPVTHPSPLIEEKSEA